MTRCRTARRSLHGRPALPDARAVGRAGRADRSFLASVTLQEVIDGIPGRKQAIGRAPTAAALGCGNAHDAAARTYLDWNATAPLRPEARRRWSRRSMSSAIRPRSHAEGRRARAIIEDAREQVAALVGAKPAEVVFTSGGDGSQQRRDGCGLGRDPAAGDRASSVLAPAQARPAASCALGADRDGGCERRADLPTAVLTGGYRSQRALLALQMANNETGVVQPVAEVAEFARRMVLTCIPMRCRPCGRVAVDFAALGVDTMTLSAHKLGGPKGVGALVIRDGSSLAPFIKGGGQERRRRAGTENVAASPALALRRRRRSAISLDSSAVQCLRDRLEGAGDARSRRRRSSPGAQACASPTPRASRCPADRPRRWSSSSISRASP